MQYFKYEMYFNIFIHKFKNVLIGTTSIRLLFMWQYLWQLRLIMVFHHLLFTENMNYQINNNLPKFFVSILVKN